MTPRERWLAWGFGLASALFVIVGCWQQLRYTDAREAIRRFVDLEWRVEQEAPDDTALIRQARPELRRSLARGEFQSTLQRLASLSQEDRAVSGRGLQGPELSPADLWPPGSPERARAAAILRLVLRRQMNGHDTEAARSALLQVADAARAGRPAEARNALLEVRRLALAAPLRPGFSQPGASRVERPSGSGAPGGRARRAAGAEEAGRLIQAFPLVLRQLRQNAATAEQRRFLDLLEPLGRELSEAHALGRDLRPIVPVLERMGRALQAEDLDDARRHLARVRAFLRSAETHGTAAPSGAAAAPGTAERGVSVAPLPPVGTVEREATPKGGTLRGPAEQILGLLDGIRALPEREYQRQRPQLGAMIGRFLDGESRARPERVPTGQPLATPAVGSDPGVRLELGPGGEILGLRARGRSLSAGLDPGGIAFSPGEGKEVRISGLLHRESGQWAQRFARPGTLLRVTYGQDGEDVFIRAAVRGDAPAAAAGLLLRLPLRLGGWSWSAGDDPGRVVSVDGNFALAPGESGALARLTLRGSGLGLRLTADTAEQVMYLPGSEVLLVRLPVPAGVGKTEHTVRLSPLPPSGRRAPPGPGAGP